MRKHMPEPKPKPELRTPPVGKVLWYIEGTAVAVRERFAYDARAIAALHLRAEAMSLRVCEVVELPSCVERVLSRPSPGADIEVECRSAA